MSGYSYETNSETIQVYSLFNIKKASISKEAQRLFCAINLSLGALLSDCLILETTPMSLILHFLLLRT